MATRRTGKSYIWVSWLAKLLGGNRCIWSAWFKAHFKYDKYEEMAGDLVRWNREHTVMMQRRQQELEADGWKVYVEDENAFKLEGEVAVVAGKADILAVKGDRALVIDGKTGRERDADVWQVMLYLFALPKIRRDLPANLEGEVHYRNGDLTITTAELTPQRMDAIVTLIRTIGSDVPPEKVPSREECKRCNIGVKDCPERITADREVAAVGEW